MKKWWRAEKIALDKCQEDIPRDIPRDIPSNGLCLNCEMYVGGVMRYDWGIAVVLLCCFSRTVLRSWSFRME